MDLSNLKPAAGSIKKAKRIGRGQGSGRGGTSTRGHKGAKSRSGYKRKRGHEGGQMPLARRTPKRGFNNIFRTEYVALNLEKIQALVEKYGFETIDMENLTKHNIVGKSKKVKVLGRGELTAKVAVNVHAISETAKSAIESAGGSVNLIEG